VDALGYSPPLPCGLLPSLQSDATRDVRKARVGRDQRAVAQSSIPGTLSVDISRPWACVCVTARPRELWLPTRRIFKKSRAGKLYYFARRRQHLRYRADPRHQHLRKWCVSTSRERALPCPRPAPCLAPAPPRLTAPSACSAAFQEGTYHPRSCEAARVDTASSRLGSTSFRNISVASPWKAE